MDTGAVGRDELFQLVSGYLRHGRKIEVRLGPRPRVEAILSVHSSRKRAVAGRPNEDIDRVLPPVEDKRGGAPSVQVLKAAAVLFASELEHTAAG